MECTLKSQIEHKTDEYNALKREHDKCLVEQQSRSEGQRFEDTERMLNDQINLLKVSSNKTKTEMHRMQNRANVLEQKLQSKEAEFDSLHSKYEALKDSFRTKAVQYSGVLREFNEYIEQNNEDRETADGRITSLREEVAELKAMQKSTSSSTNRRRRKPKPFARKRSDTVTGSIKSGRRGMCPSLFAMKWNRPRQLLGLMSMTSTLRTTIVMMFHLH